MGNNPAQSLTRCAIPEKRKYFPAMMHLFHRVSDHCSRIVTEEYSTSFSAAVRLLHRDLREPIYAIYGFVRLVDEVVDTFHQYDKVRLLSGLRVETFLSITRELGL